MDAKPPVIPGFDERRFGASRYFVGGSGPPLALVHGLGGFAGNWRFVAPALAETRRVIAIDLPGHGGSAVLPETPVIDLMEALRRSVAEVQDRKSDAKPRKTKAASSEGGSRRKPAARKSA